MKVAIPLLGTRVAPRFDLGAVVLVAELDGEDIRSMSRPTPFSGWPVCGRPGSRRWCVAR